MKVGDLVKYHRAGKSPKIGIVTKLSERSLPHGCTAFYCFVNFTDTQLKLRDDHLEVISANR